MGTNQLDNILVRELGLYMTNDRDIYFKRVIPYAESLAKKAVKGNFDKTKAIKGFETVVVPVGIQQYRKDFGLGVVTAANKKAIAEYLYDYYSDLIKEMTKAAKKTAKAKKTTKKSK